MMLCISTFVIDAMHARIDWNLHVNLVPMAYSHVLQCLDVGSPDAQLNVYGQSYVPGSVPLISHAVELQKPKLESFSAVLWTMVGYGLLLYSLLGH